MLHFETFVEISRTTKTLYFLWTPVLHCHRSIHTHILFDAVAWVYEFVRVRLHKLLQDLLSEWEWRKWFCCPSRNYFFTNLNLNLNSTICAGGRVQFPFSLVGFLFWSVVFVPAGWNLEMCSGFPTWRVEFLLHRWVSEFQGGFHALPNLGDQEHCSYHQHLNWWSSFSAA